MSTTTPTPCRWVNNVCTRCNMTRTRRNKRLVLRVVDNAFSWQRFSGFVYERDGVKYVTKPDCILP